MLANYFEGHTIYFNGDNNLFIGVYILEGFEPLTLHLLDNPLYLLIHSGTKAQNKNSSHLKQHEQKYFWETHFGINQWFSTGLDLVCDSIKEKHPQHSDVSEGHRGFMMEINTICQSDSGLQIISSIHSPDVTERKKELCVLTESAAVWWTADALGTPDTRRSGRSTRNALSALTSRPPGFPAAWWASPGLWSVMASAITLNNLDNTHTRSHTQSQVRFPLQPATQRGGSGEKTKYPTMTMMKSSKFQPLRM